MIATRWLRTWALAGLAALLLVAVVIVALGGRDAWAPVAKNLRSKTWVRCTLQLPAGAQAPPGFEPPEVWFSAQRKVGARRFQKAVQFIDFAQRECRDYGKGGVTLLVSSVGDHETRDFGFLDMLVRLVFDGAPDLELSRSPVELLERSQRDLRTGDRQWIEFTFNFRDPRRIPCDFLATLRVDPRSRLPIDMTSTEKFPSEESAVLRTYVFDYPQSGPADIYALGVPHDVLILDRRGRKPIMP
ncbi:MAG TPA: hypothetical protein VGZ22_30930 [Isosphaeraceae bacterium]|jgi:hypothetical protein|nr:hypothetical protein [Isosphaeraceae bacterium]